MAVEPDVLLRTAALARLTLSPEETERLAAQLADILDHIERLMAIDVDTAQAAPLALDPAEPTRADIPGADPLVRPPGDLAAGWREDFFTVPRVLAP